MRPPIKYTIIALLITMHGMAQSGEIRGRVLEPGSAEGVPFASVSAAADTGVILSTVADIDGNFTLKPLLPGKYKVKAACVGYQPREQRKVPVTADKITFLNIEL